MGRIVAGLLFAVALCVVLGATDAEAQRRGSRRDAAGDKAEGKTVFRGGISLDGSRSINLGGETGTSAAINAAITPGVGYYFADNASVDFDVEGSLQLSPAFGFNTLGVTPGVRYEISQVYARVGAPVVVYQAFGLGVLGGVGYLQPITEKTKAIFGVDYTYWLTPAFRRASPYGKIDLKLGVQQSF